MSPGSDHGNPADVWLPKDLREDAPPEPRSRDVTRKDEPPVQGREWLPDEQAVPVTTPQPPEAEVQGDVDGQGELEARFADLEQRLKVREAELAEARRREAKLNARIDELQGGAVNSNHATVPQQAPAQELVSSGRGKVPLNGASFDELRNLGLSITQSERLISYRDSRGGFESLNEIDEVPGFPADVRQALKDQLTLS
jgi:DNA uptake protein ComE-like DNA-binding protein